MPRILTPQRKAILKKSLLENRGAKQALLDAGFSPTTAENSTCVKSVKVCQAEIEQDIKKLITVETVLKSIQNIKSLAITAEDYSTATRCDELCGRWLAMWRDRLEIVPVEAVDGQFSVSRLTRMRAIPVSGGDITPQPDER